jgi:divalent metal cation (Fe/Co/Zn/Cd) transporter
MPEGNAVSAATAATRSPQVWLRRAARLVGATALYNLVEAGLAIGAGVAAGSIALVGFGLDSVIELSAGVVVFRRLQLEARGVSAARLAGTERRVRRFVGVTFFLLAAYVVIQAVVVLALRAAPAESRLGIGLAIASTIVMPAIAWGKLRAADALGSRALRAEAKETLACAYLSIALLLGLAANALLGWWWADPAAALLMVPWLVHEGREALEDECDDDDH